MKRNWSLSAGALALVVLAACSDDRTTGPAGQEAFSRYVAVGTSLSMGVQSDGVVYFSQQHDWTTLLSHMAFAQYTQPLVAAPGCFSPLIAPLQLSRRLSGISAAANQTTSIPDTTCTLFGPSTTIPANDVAIDGANTYDALYVTPETASVEGVKRRRQYRLVLPAKTTQITAMMRQNPTLVSVELGANEALGAASGLLFPKAGYRGALPPEPSFRMQCGSRFMMLSSTASRKLGRKCYLLECQRRTDSCRCARVTSCTPIAPPSRVSASSSREIVRAVRTRFSYRSRF